MILLQQPYDTVLFSRQVMQIALKSELQVRPCQAELIASNSTVLSEGFLCIQSCVLLVKKISCSI